MVVPRSHTSLHISALEYVGLSGILAGLLGSTVEEGTAKIKSRNVPLKRKVSQKGSALIASAALREPGWVCLGLRAQHLTFILNWFLSPGVTFWPPQTVTVCS